MVKVVRKSKVILKTINLGKPYEPACILADLFIQKNGPGMFSQLVRNLLITYLSNSPEYKDWKIMFLKHKRQKIKQTIKNSYMEKYKVEEELKTYGVDI